MHTQTFFLLLSFFTAAALSASPALAECGDDINGERVACRCGDVVVSDTTLMATDPVASQACISDGLLLRARKGAKSIRLDLNGLTLQGSGVGAGVRVVDGGSNGAVITGSNKGGGATITGFRVGVSARGRRLLASLEHVVAADNATNGIVVDALNAHLDHVVAIHNGRDGLQLGGRGSTATNVRTMKNGGHGVRLRGAGNTASGISTKNGLDSTKAIGRANTLNMNTTSGSGE
jgi:hypothetical protein